MENYYETLGISRSASADEIKQVTQQQIQLIKTAYDTLSDTAKRHAYEASHSDINYYRVLDADSSATTTRLKLTAQEKLAHLKSIYQTLSDPAQREAYDASLAETKATPQPSVQMTAGQEVDVNPYAAPDTIVTDMMIDTNVQLASRSSRLGAYIIDFMVYVTPLSLIFFVGFGLNSNISPEMTPEEMEYAIESIIMSPQGMMYMTAFMGVLLIVFIINLILLYRNGQTIGKKILGIKIIRSDYTRAGLLRIILLRYFVIGLLGGIPILGALITLVNYLMIFGKSRRCLHDYIADTIVVKA